MPVLELPRRRLADLTYETFLREFALPRQPLIIEDVGRDWPAASSWPDLAYFLSHAGVDLEFEVSVNEGDDVKERAISVGEAIRQLQQREADPVQAQPPLYLSAWEYVRGGSGMLQDDFSVPALFDRSPRFLAEHAVLGCAAVDMKWLYIGEKGTGSKTHVDTNMTSAWLWVARGEKEWVRRPGPAGTSPLRAIPSPPHFTSPSASPFPAFPSLAGTACVRRSGLLKYTARPLSSQVCAHGDDYEVLAAAAVRGDADDEYGATFPDLMAAIDCDGQAHPTLDAVRLFHGFQRAGDVCFNPSRCVHAVRNTAPTVSLTHNYIDASNVRPRPPACPLARLPAFPPARLPTTCCSMSRPHAVVPPGLRW